MSSKPILQSLKIHVSDEHIAHAQRKNSHHCMIADAIRDSMPEAKFISVDLQSIRFSIFKDGLIGKGTRYFYFTPTIAQHALLKFDQGVKVREFEFTARSGVMKNIPLPRGKKDKVKRSHASRGVKKHIVKKEREFGIRMFENVEKSMPRLVKKSDDKFDPKVVRKNVSQAV